MNIKITRHVFIAGLISALVLSPDASIGQRTKSSLKAGNQRNAEKGLKDNRYFFYFINSSITNLGTDEEKKIFKEAIQRDIIARQLNLKFLFEEAFNEVIKSQKILIELYRRILGKDIVMARQLLNGFAPAVIDTKGALGRKYLQLGYREAADAQIDMTMADNFRETLYSMRLYRYAKAIKKVKQAKRYAFFALLESKVPHEKNKNFGLIPHDELGNLIAGASSDDRKNFHSLIHADNYYKLKDGKSFYDQVWEKPDLDEIKEYKEYLMK